MKLCYPNEKCKENNLLWHDWLYPVTEDVHVFEGDQILDCEIVGDWEILTDSNMLLPLQNHGFIQQKFMVQI